MMWVEPRFPPSPLMILPGAGVGGSTPHAWVKVGKEGPRAEIEEARQQ